MAKTLYTNVSGRSHKAKNQHATCNECKQRYIDWKFIGQDGRCYQCHGIEEFEAPGSLKASEAMIKFVAENR